MRRNCLFFTIFAVGCILLLQIGCHEQQKQTKESKTELVEPKSVSGSPASTGDEVRLEPPPAKVKMPGPRPRERGPGIAFEKVVHNFGEVNPGSRNACEFKFTNNGDAVLKIGRIISTCGCAVPRLAKKEYAPGESGTVKVIYRASRYPGPAMRRLYVPSNDRAKPKVGLTIKARVPRKIVYKPKELKLSLRGEKVGCPEITLTSVDGKPFGVKSFRTPRGCITASFDSAAKATEVVLQPKVHIEKLGKRSNGRITIGLNHPQCDMVTIPFSVMPAFKVKPRSIVIHNAEPQKPIRREVLILSNYGDNFEIESASSKKGMIKILHQQKLGSRYKFDLEIAPLAAGDNRRGVFTDVLCVNVKGGEKLEIKCSVFYSKK